MHGQPRPDMWQTHSGQSGARYECPAAVAGRLAQLGAGGRWPGAAPDASGQAANRCRWPAAKDCHAVGSARRPLGRALGGHGPMQYFWPVAWVGSSIGQLKRTSGFF